MKTKLIFSVYILCGLFLKAQIHNSSFENLTQQGKVKNWGSFILIPFVFDTLGNSHADSVVYDNQLYFSTNDAHTGSKALELRNAFYYSNGQKIAGRAKMSENDTDYTAFAPLTGIVGQPTHFSFYYKFFPTNNDTAWAYMTVMDSNGYQLGDANIEVTGYHSNYTHISKPINYTIPGAAAYISVEFASAKPFTVPNFGTRFLIDDVNLAATSIQKNKSEFMSLKIQPNPVNEKLEIVFEKNTELREVKIKLCNESGQIIFDKNMRLESNTIQLNTAELKAGTYIVKLETLKGTYTARFVK